MGLARKDYDPKQTKPEDLKDVILKRAVLGTEKQREDQRDAILGAFTAQMMVRRNSSWVDLLRYEKKERILADDLPIGYWMPRKFISLRTDTENRKQKTENRKLSSKC
jgi:hypothetical protein